MKTSLPNTTTPEALEAAKRARTELAKPFECFGCGARLSEMAAQYAIDGDFGCPSCGGVEIDWAITSWIISYGGTPVSRVTV